MSILLDGSSAGGQFVRTAVALSAITGKAIKIINIRGSRKPPGLKVQHMEGINAISNLCNANVKGLELGSQELLFEPARLEAKDLNIEISTAGSIGLVLQALLLVTAHLDKSIKITFRGGGTWNKWAPPVCYLQKVLFPLIGEKTGIKIIREGFYPKGSAEVQVVTKPLMFKEIFLEDIGEIKDIKCISVASESLKKSMVAERQVQMVESIVKEKFSKPFFKEILYSTSVCPGSGILVVMHTSHSILGSDAIGEPGKPAEEVGKEAMKFLISGLGKGAVDIHAGDMILPYMAFSGAGRISVPVISQHILVNIDVLQKMLNVIFNVKGNKGEPGIVELVRADP